MLVGNPILMRREYIRDCDSPRLVFDRIARMREFRLQFLYRIADGVQKGLQFFFGILRMFKFVVLNPTFPHSHVVDGLCRLK